MLAFPEADLTSEERDTFFDRIAEEVCKRGMVVPAVLALEMHRPLAFLSSQALVVFSPMLAPAFGWPRLQKLYRLLERRENLDLLLERIEREAHARQRRPRAGDNGLIEDHRKETTRD